jgi:arylsulfatase A-like enzyme
VFVSLHFNAGALALGRPGDRAKSAAISKAVHRDGGTVQTYREMLDSLDRNVGRVLDALQELDQARNTVVIFTSDNGGERFSDMWPPDGHEG